jgi:hypothetical protein
MSVDLEDKPGAVYDDNKPAWKTNLHDDDLEKSFDAPSATDDDLPDGHPSKAKKELSTNELRDKESTTSKDLKNEAGNEEAASFYKNNSRQKRSFRSRISRKQAGIGIAIAGSLISVFTFITLQAPNLIINNLKELLLDRMSTVQMFHSRRYRQKTMPKLKNYFSKDGRMAQKIVNEMSADGYKPIFSPDGKTIIGLQPPQRGANGIIGTGIGDNIDAYMERKHPFRTARWKTKRMNALYKTFSVSRSSVVDAQKPRAGPDGEDLAPKQTVNSRAAKEVLEGDDEQIDILRSDVSSEETDPDAKTADEARREEINTQSSDIGDDLKGFKERLINEGVDISELNDDDLAKVLSEAGDGFTGDLGELINRVVRDKSIGSKITDGVGSVLKPLDMLDRVCTIRRRIAAAKMLARAARSASLIRYAMVFINAADDTRRGNADPKLVNELMKRITAEDKNGNAIGASPGFGYLMKSKFSKSKNDVSRSSVAVDGKLTGIPGGISDTIDRVPGMQSGCPYIQNPLIQVGAGIGSIALGFFTGGSSTTATTLASQGVKAALKEVIENAITKTVLKQVLFSIATEVAKELTFEGIMLLTEMYVQKNLNLPFTGQEKGGQLGDILVGGTGAANKQRSLAAGMVPATTQQYAQAQNEYIAWKNEDFKNMSFKDRMFNMENTHSLVFNLATMVPSGATDAARKTTDSTISMASTALNPGKIMQATFNLFSSKAGASDDISFDEYEIKGGDLDGQKLATDTAGNLQVIMRSDIESIDPETNIEDLKSLDQINGDTLEPTNDFAEHVKNCVDSADLLTPIESGDEFDCMAREEVTKKFKAHLAYLDLVDGLEAEFFPEEIATGVPSSTSGSSAPTGGFAVPYTNPIDISLTSVIPGTSVRIATNTLPQFQNMLNAAKAEGIDLLPISSGWRDPQKQIELRKQNCPDWQNSDSSDCRPPTAKPGTSIHERGQAIDFGNMCYPNGKTCPGNPRWEWLTVNAGKFGFKPLSSEAWHWSVTGN